MTTPTETAIDLLTQARQHDIEAQALRREAGKLLAELTPRERKQVAALSGMSEGGIDLLAGDGK